MSIPNHVDNAIYDLLTGLGWGITLGFPIGTGNVFWVSALLGADTNVGTRPDQPFATITYALTQCVANNNDYIIVIDDYQEAATVTVNITRTHIIGLGNFLRPNSNHPYVVLNATGAWPIFTVGTEASNCEIAGFSLGGGPANAGIENVAGTPTGLHIHDCVFGHSLCADTPQDGILIDNNAIDIRIENCIFLGAPGGKGTLTRDGIRWDCAAGDPLNGNIEKNQFKALPGIGINFVAVTNAAGGITIKDNVLSCGADVQGSAITLAATTRGFIVEGNKALYGPATAAMANNPYLDNTIVAPFNAWMNNYKGNALIDPA